MHGGDLEVLNAFVVPSEAPWPEETRGVKLGHRVHNFRNHKQHLKHHPERRAELDALGSVYSCGTIWSGGGRRCAPRCWRTRRCTVQVPGAFVRPPEAPWPERRYGVSQEHFVEDHPERRAELDALGFVWDDLERRTRCWHNSRCTATFRCLVRSWCRRRRRGVARGGVGAAAREQGDQHPPQGGLCGRPPGAARGAGRDGLPLACAGLVKLAMRATLSTRGAAGRW